ncbi:GNAT family N-acetyltransferase [Sporosarcina sp. ANT_H38]|uniref:GNAT family N-acetyltransferase n=1 Tax=Sporosarcina sp. ANT_H38 TaxID=2597358 RepID=UPI0011F2BD6D|nr:GNAT family N-acetyltransferase [Sporosarcina sp. ANT_H38]KAA0955901.1 GNAT family N-acetyltransferase [Sporosarcina sp. ANT_H38]
MDITIRQAQPADAEQAAPLIIDAIGDIAKRMTGEKEWDKVEQELCVLFKREDNRHSHLYTYIAELDEKVAGIMVLYAGADALELDQNLSEWLAKKGTANSEVDAESLADELYIDTVCIDPAFRGQGIGTTLFEYAEEVAKQKNSAKLSLNVETEKESAIRLYKRLGYEIVSPWTIIGEPFHHMVKIIN